jgi:hypothetical protein
MFFLNINRAKGVMKNNKQASLWYSPKKLNPSQELKGIKKTPNKIRIKEEFIMFGFVFKN